MVVLTLNDLKSREEVLRTLRAELPYLRERFGVKRLALYGSFARGEQTEDSHRPHG
ncbi:nucleotidyltransferase family protein [Ammonifex thiophilus]|uniref:Polymerase nucleotidyl transferase domain-containing protein n=1 Tax=Ammonifex thiophilus TaxID=444093 RepID=A0A3D8P722_9THEO|nr:hypothetical protein DXX99_02500 [Ammonifex thiophilus]